MKTIIAFLKNKNYPFAIIVLWTAIILGFYITYFLSPNYLKVLSLILSALGVLYYVLSEHNKIDKGDELEKKIYLETLSYSLNSVFVAAWCLILIDLNAYRLGGSIYTILFFISMVGIYPTCKYFVRKKYT